MVCGRSVTLEPVRDFSGIRGERRSGRGRNCRTPCVGFSHGIAGLGCGGGGGVRADPRGLDALRAAGVEPVDAGDARAWVREVEGLGRRIRSMQVELVDVIDRQGLHRVDGHASAKVMVRHTAGLSAAEAARRARAARALRDLPETKAALAAGEVGVCQVDRIARAHANPRVRAAFCAQDVAVARAAAATSYRAFDAEVTDWVRLIDADAPVTARSAPTRTVTPSWCRTTTDPGRSPPSAGPCRAPRCTRSSVGSSTPSSPPTGPTPATATATPQRSSTSAAPTPSGASTPCLRSTDAPPPRPPALRVARRS